MNAFAKYFDSNNKYMNILVYDKELLKKYNAVWDKINNLFKKEFDSKPVYNDKYIKAKISLYNVNFYGIKAPKENECYTCLSVILLDSIADVDKKYYPQIFSGECKYVVKKKKIMNTINEELNLDESDKSDESDEDLNYVLNSFLILWI